MLGKISSKPWKNPIESLSVGKIMNGKIIFKLLLLIVLCAVSAQASYVTIGGTGAA